MPLSSLLLSLDGRISRSKWWLGQAILLVPMIVAQVLVDMQPGGAMAIGGLIALAIIWPSIAISAKRWHDRDKSAWWILVGIIPLIGFIWLIIECGCLKGSDGANRFGDDPLAGTPAGASASLR